jgi:hypothetical protein
MAIHGIWGRPFIDLERHVDIARLPEIDAEICYALTQIQVDYTGGSHRSMGIVPPSLLAEPYVDYGEVIAGFTREEFVTFVSLADDPAAFDPDQRDRYEWGEEREVPLTRKQMLYLKYRYGVYFPWKVFYELIPGRYWSDKSTGKGKSFTREARVLFPRTIDFVRSLPFAEIGRCNIMGLEANDHGTVHRDGEPGEAAAPDHFITVCPRGDKRLFLWDEERREKTPVSPRAYWFNDSDYHGVEADPFFRYSIRVDGVFRDEFVTEISPQTRAK